MPVITLATDTGETDFLTGAMKGQLISAIPGAVIMDITHRLSPHNYLQASYICKNAYNFFPPATIHIIIINFFEKIPTHVLMAQINNQFIICPDNGILTMIAGGKPNTVAAIPMQASKNTTLLECFSFIAAAAKRIIAGENLFTANAAIADFEEKYAMRSASGNNWIETQIIYIDHFENVVLNLTRDEFEELRQKRKFKIVLMRNSEFIENISTCYADVQPGEKLAWFNSAGYLEIAINKGNMAGLFGLQKFSESNGGSQNRLMYQMVRILFE